MTDEIQTVEIEGSAIGGAIQFSKAIAPLVKLVETMKKVCDALKDIQPFLSPYVSYEAAGYPYGKSIRGFKKWRKKKSSCIVQQIGIL